MAMSTDMREDYSRGAIGTVGMSMCERAAKEVYEKARVGLQHNLGLGGACVVALYKGL